MISGFAIVELMGHVRMAGMVAEETIFGATMGRCDAIQRDGSIVSTWFGSSSIYRVTLTDEETAKRVAGCYIPPRPLMAPVEASEPEEEPEEIELPPLDPSLCPNCRGFGKVHDPFEEDFERDCRWCKGSGKTADIEWLECSACDGSGECPIMGDQCGICQGRGKVATL